MGLSDIHVDLIIAGAHVNANGGTGRPTDSNSLTADEIGISHVNNGDDILDSEAAGTQHVYQVVLNPTIDAVSPDDCPHVNHFDVFPDEEEFV